MTCVQYIYWLIVLDQTELRHSEEIQEQKTKKDNTTYNDQFHQYTTAIRLSSGVIVSDKINVDRANVIWTSILIDIEEEKAMCSKIVMQPWLSHRE